MQKKADLIINCYEKTYERVLNRQFIEGKIKQNKFSFKNIFIVINNIQDKKTAENMANKLKKEGVIANAFWVKKHLGEALNKCGLKSYNISKLKHYTDRALVCNEIAQSEYFVHRDPDVSLEMPIDWITPCIQKMEQDKSILIANPLRYGREKEGKFRYKEEKEFYRSYGFSDQLYLAKKQDLLRDIYEENHIYTSRFPLYPIDKTFEARIDAYMRKKNMTRLVYKKATYIHELGKGSPYPKYSLFQYVKRISMFLIRRIYCTLFYNHTTNTRKHLFR